MRGVFPILAMPFDAAGRIDVESLQREVDYLVQARVHGVGIALASSEDGAGWQRREVGRTRDAETAWARVRKEFPDHALSARASLDLAQAAFGRNAFKDAAAQPDRLVAFALNTPEYLTT